VFLTQKRYNFEELAKQEQLHQLFPNLHRQPMTALDGEIAQLRRIKKQYTESLGKMKASMSSAARFNNDPASRHAAQRLQDTMDELDELEKQRNDLTAPDITGAAVALAGNE